MVLFRGSIKRENMLIERNKKTLLSPLSFRIGKRLIHRLNVTDLKTGLAARLSPPG